MSRSYRRNPICGWSTARSEKKDKRLANRAWRRRVRTCLLSGRDLPDRREISEVYSFDKDGKQYFDQDKFPEGMRK